LAPFCCGAAASLKVLTEELHKEIEAGRIQILFPSSENVVSPEAYPSLQKVAAAIGKILNPVRLEGHTDSRPISTSRFHSNWELSAARNIALLELFSTHYGVPRQRMSIAGYADTAPAASKDTEEGRARNRRCDVVILNERGIVGEPLKPADVKPKP
jgi:chemotaxis protein MotB